jgi:hypothetical protein
LGNYIRINKNLKTSTILFEHFGQNFWGLPMHK